MNGRSVLPLAGLLCLAGCVVETAGPAQHEYRTIDRDKAELVRVDLNMGAGNLRVDSGTDKLVAADFTYNVASWKPEMRYSNAAGRGTLSIAQPERGHTHFGRTDYEWDLRLNREVPIEFTARFGAGEAHLDLGGLILRTVEVDMGVGHLDLDLHGQPKESYDVRIRGGVGEATVRVPSNIGVEAEAHGGIGEIKASGMRRDGNRYYNDAYGDSKVTIHLDVQGGVGSIRLISD
ncbi:MAG: toast rack family protein [Acidobacteriia bacterium]|nr:toast rack family protein [Terriglobia bacterium]